MSFEESIMQAIDNGLKSSLPKYVNQLLSDLDDKLNLRTYSMNEASQISGIGYTKIYNATRNGKLPSLQDGRNTRIRHTDFLRWIEAEKLKSKLQ